MAFARLAVQAMPTWATLNTMAYPDDVSPSDARASDYAMSEVCYRVAVEGAGVTAPRAALFNDYADTLRHLKRFVEAERYARLAIVESGGKTWLCKLTLAEVLQDAGKAPDEVRSLLAEVERLKLDQGRKAK